MTGLRDPKRAQKMAEMFRSGLTYKQVGDCFGVSRQAVQQILRNTYRLTRLDGGATPARIAQRQKDADDKAAALERYSANVFGLSLDVMRTLKDDPSRPLEAYRHQRFNAHRRGIRFRLTVGQWWQIWQESGHWAERGRGHGFCMCRKEDKGAYEVGNVFIATCAWNAHEYSRRETLRPIGVNLVGDGEYVVRADGDWMLGDRYSSLEAALAEYIRVTGDQNAAVMLLTGKLYDFGALRRWRSSRRVSVYSATYRFGVTRRNWLKFEGGIAPAPRLVALAVGADLGIDPARISPAVEVAA